MNVSVRGGTVGKLWNFGILGGIFTDYYKKLYWVTERSPIRLLKETLEAICHTTHIQLNLTELKGAEKLYADPSAKFAEFQIKTLLVISQVYWTNQSILLNFSKFCAVTFSWKEGIVCWNLLLGIVECRGYLKESQEKIRKNGNNLGWNLDECPEEFLGGLSAGISGKISGGIQGWIFFGIPGEMGKEIVKDSES